MAARYDCLQEICWSWVVKLRQAFSLARISFSSPNLQIVTYFLSVIRPEASAHVLRSTWNLAQKFFRHREELELESRFRVAGCQPWRHFQERVACSTLASKQLEMVSQAGSSLLKHQIPPGNMRFIADWLESSSLYNNCPTQWLPKFSVYEQALSIALSLIYPPKTLDWSRQCIAMLATKQYRAK